MPEAPRSRVLLAGCVVLVLLAAGVTAAVITRSRRPDPLDPAGVSHRQGVEMFTAAWGARLRADWWAPAPGPTARPVIVFVHGGGWSGGGRIDFAPWGERAARAGFVAFSIDYRLDLGDRRTKEIDDVRHAVRWVAAQAPSLGGDSARLALVGASAGGHLATLTAYEPGDGGPRVKAVVAWSGIFDLPALYESPPDGVDLASLVRNYVGCPRSECPQAWTDASPVNHVDPSDPPTLLVASRDEFVPWAQVESLAGRLRSAQVPVETIQVPGADHANALGDRAWLPTLEFLRRRV